MRSVPVLSRLLRVLTATAVALSWSVVAALPAPAAVTGWGVQTPSADAVLGRATDLVVYVDRTAPPEDESVEVRTRFLDAAGEPLSDKVLNLRFKRQIPNDTGDQLLFGGTINPNELAWLAEPRAVANGRYTLQLQVHVVTGDVERTTEWNDHPLVFDAPPPPPGRPDVKVADAAAKRLQISWEPSRVPDLLHYSVERRVDGGPWQTAQNHVAPDATQITDTGAAFGSYRYRVTAVRPAGNRSDGSDRPAAPDAPEASDAPDPAESEAPRDGSNGREEYRTAQSEPSSTTELEAPREPARRGTNTAGNQEAGGSSGDDAGSGVQAPAPRAQPPQFNAPADANQTYEGPLDFGVEPAEVTERVPIEVARGGTSEDGGTLRVLSRSLDQERVLPAVAGGLIFLLSAAHVVRYLNE